MVTYRDVVDAWDQADPRCIHPSRDESEESYWESGRVQAERLTAALLTAGLPAGGRVLDYGCGDGRVAIPMAAAGWRMVAADASPRMIERLRAHTSAVQVVPLDALPEVDAAYCLAVLIHHDWASVRFLVAAVRAAVRPGGLLVLDWPIAARPVERRGWIEVTTWGEREREETARRLGLHLVPSGMPWPVYRTGEP